MVAFLFQFKNMKSFDLYILHDASLVVCLSVSAPRIKNQKFVLLHAPMIEYIRINQKLFSFDQQVGRHYHVHGLLISERSNFFLSFWP